MGGFHRAQPVALVDFGNLASGDCVAGIATVHYLRSRAPNLFTDSCLIRVPGAVATIADVALAPLGFTVVTSACSADPACQGVRIIMRSPRAIAELIDAARGKAIYVAWEEGCRLAVAWKSEWQSRGFAQRLRFSILELLQYKTIAPRAAVPLYVGFRMFFPLLMRIGDTVTAHLVAAARSFGQLGDAMRAYVETSTAIDARDAPVRGKVVVFPSAASFNVIPLSLCRDIGKRFGEDICFALHEADPLYVDACRELRSVTAVSTVEQTLQLIRYNYAVAVDSFVSHLVQLMTADALVIFTRELPQRFVHPGARIRTLNIYPECAPCAYRQRASDATCPAGNPHCSAFDTIDARLDDEIRRGIARAKSLAY